MKHFLVEITYTAPITRIDELVSAHRAYLQGGYDKGLLLYSGGQVPRTGGIVLARADSREAVDTFFAEDPYNQAGAAEYRVVEFAPAKFQPFLANWVAGE